jgi:hypothetical protein
MLTALHDNLHRSVGFSGELKKNESAFKIYVFVYKEGHYVPAVERRASHEHSDEVFAVPSPVDQAEVTDHPE